MSTTGRGHIRGFDGVRAIAVLLVVVAHLGLYYHLPETRLFQLRLWNVISGSIGVFAFFTLSGFLITLLLLREKQTFGRINVPYFFARRALRLFPAMIAFLAVVSALMFSGVIKESYLGLGLASVYLFNYVPRAAYTGELGHTWSLGIEEQYYIIWVFVVAYLSRRKALGVAIVLAVACIALRGLIPTWSIPPVTGELTIGQYFRPSAWFLPAALPILVGSCVAFAYDRSPERFQSAGWGIGGISLFLYPLYVADSLLAHGYIVQGIGLSMFLAWAATNQGSIVVRALDIKPVAYLGKISYGVYVWQGLFLRTGPGWEPKAWFQTYPVNLVFVFIAAWLSYRYIEEPALRLKRKFRPHREARPDEPGAFSTVTSDLPQEV